MKKQVRYLYTLPLLSFIFFLCTQSIYAASHTPPSLTNSNIKKLSEHVYVMQGEVNDQTPQNQGFNSNTTFVITQDSVVVMDPGGSYRIGKMAIEQIRKLTDKPISHVFNSHHHPDHWLGNHAFSELKPKPIIIGHPYMIKRAGEIAQRALKRLNKMTQGAHSDTKIVLPDTTASGMERFRIGGKTFVLIHPTHAHTKGDLIVYVPEEKLVVTGDVFFHLRTPGFQDASPLGNETALHYLSILDINKVVPGHGPVTDRAGLQYMINYISLLHNQVEEYYQKGFTDLEMMGKINVGKYHNMSGFKNRFPVNVNSMYLEVVKKTGKKLFLRQIGVK